ncbi:hypothetical protein D3C84_739180 [compost metagenome]
MVLGGAVFKKLTATPLILASSVVHAQTLSCNCITDDVSSRLDLDTKTGRERSYTLTAKNYMSVPGGLNLLRYSALLCRLLDDGQKYKAIRQFAVSKKAAVHGCHIKYAQHGRFQGD